MKKYIFASALVLFFSCSSSKPPACATVGEKEKELSADQRLLNHGYATLYGSFESFKWLDRLLAVKMEAQEVHDLVDDLRKTGKKIAEKFETLQKKYPNLEIDEMGRNAVTQLKSKTQTHDRLESFMPVVGKTGKDFERTLVLFVSGATGELKYLAQTLEKIEPDAGLKAFDREIQIESIRLEDRALKLLNERYFKDNFFEPQTPPKN